jgi:hypothetical protein
MIAAPKGERRPTQQHETSSRESPPVRFLVEEEVVAKNCEDVEARLG